MTQTFYADMNKIKKKTIEENLTSECMFCLMIGLDKKCQGEICLYFSYK
jgi:hypothetical protein